MVNRFGIIPPGSCLSHEFSSAVGTLLSEPPKPRPEIPNNLSANHSPDYIKPVQACEASYPLSGYKHRSFIPRNIIPRSTENAQAYKDSKEIPAGKNVDCTF